MDVKRHASFVAEMAAQLITAEPDSANAQRAGGKQFASRQLRTVASWLVAHQATPSDRTHEV